MPEPKRKPARRRGPIELKVAALVRELAVDPAAGHEVYAAQAAKLARTLDSAGPEYLATAAVSRELRETVKALTARGEGGDGDARARELLAGLSAPLGYSAN